MAGKGRAKTGGRRKGVPNKLTSAVKEAILTAFDEVGGAAYLVAVAENDPKTFCSLLGRVLPAEIRADVRSPSGEALSELVRGARLRLAAERESSTLV